MDLESYIGRYSGETRLRRLISIAQGRSVYGAGNNNNSNLNLNLIQRQRALDLAEKQMLKDGNVQLYRQVFAGNGNDSGEDTGGGGRIFDMDLFESRPPLDVNWMNTTETTNRDKRQILEGRLSSAQSRLHKDAIRTAYLALAEHDLRSGRDMKIAPTTTTTTTTTTTNNTITNNDKVIDLVKDSAFTNVNSSLFRAMDYSTSKLQTAQIGLLILESALNAGNFISVPIIRDIGVKVQIAKGIERMVAKDYRGAANAFFPLVMKGSGDSDDSNNNNNNNTHMLHWRGVISPEDVALYAGLMCLVTRDRSKMITLTDDPEALELVPAVKELLVYYSRANYEPCMRAISCIHDSDTSASTSTSTSTSLSQPLLPLGVVVDVYLTPTRWNTLIQTIRENCVVEYLRPYQRVKLESLKDLFFPNSSDDNDNNNNDLDSVIDTLVDLMDRKLLPSTTRLDCREKILFQKQPSQNPTLRINSMEERIMDDSHAMLVRLASLVPGGAAMADSSSDDGDDDDDDEGAYFEDMDAFDGQGGGGGDHDTHMVDVDASAAAHHPAAMNPEDMY
ncbi:hypothetical protein FRACYDRAFT_264453 [Fragilariopsis cylindrus CCMP1102]|uniref:26S proteasome regulatory subunit Rpn7 N-terminal domain-containing protein n=1 Tax=Fragilariopsis cylindrus CCMP1102 TaxID=635003 RepID=A0A1E7ES87_9STRA|nr:hypothetical protein FRACYDRAFT_264453 [Fragilariopsis cylindrus CCMP1102]|eukprot:OEU08880.1 hypothetical protein FRACYDRAFT_264453 [Fragilariopsis cylindrus CCMP1102]